MRRRARLSALSGLCDQALLGALRFRFDRDPGSIEDRRAHLHDLAQFYRQLGDGLFVTPPPASLSEIRRGRLSDGGEIVDLAWPSDYEPAFPPARTAYLAHRTNRRACARLFRHPSGDRPLLLLWHGYQGGHFLVEERAFPVRALYRRGLDVALLTLPFHALRGEGGAPAWPSLDVARTNEGFGQAVFDLRALVRRLEPPRVAVAGMSLGGYTTALLATLVTVDFVCPMVPVAELAPLFWERWAGARERRRAQHEGLGFDLFAAAMAVHSPLLRAVKLAPQRMLVVSALDDRIAPSAQSAKLAEHFGCEELRVEGGHLLQLGRGQAFGALEDRLQRAGVIPAE